MLKNIANRALVTLLGGLSLGFILFSGCQQPATQTQRRPNIIYHPLPTQATTPPNMSKKDYPLRLNDAKQWEYDFKVFYQQNQLDDKNSYIGYLSKQQKELPPLNEMMRSAKSWQECGSSRYSLPYFELWQNILPTIKLLNQLEREGVLTDFEITSGYRDMALNVCAGGSPNSKHMLNAALDIRLLGEQTTEAGQIEFKQKLCDFWKTQGPELKMGLGLYANGQIHIDTQGFRTWGPDYSWRSSICGE